jgi:predicted transcriptional regulator
MENFDLSQKQIAEIVNLTPAAISQYISDKRGGIEITDEKILSEIDKSARIIYDKGAEQLATQICRICTLLKSTEQVSKNIGYLSDSQKTCGKTICKNNELFFENIVWNILPAIRKEFAKKLIKNHELTQRKVANILGITEAAVSRYVSGKRGLFEITDKKILREIKISTDRIIRDDNKTVIKEICRICTLLKSTDLIKDIS